MNDRIARILAHLKRNACMHVFKLRIRVRDHEPDFIENDWVHDMHAATNQKLVAASM